MGSFLARYTHACRYTLLYILYMIYIYIYIGGGVVCIPSSFPGAVPLSPPLLISHASHYNLSSSLTFPFLLS